MFEMEMKANRRKIPYQMKISLAEAISDPSRFYFISKTKPQLFFPFLKKEHCIAPLKILISLQSEVYEMDF